MITLLGTEEATVLFDALANEPPVSIRFNTLKNPVGFHFTDAELILWDAHSRYLSSRPSFTYDPVFHAGGYYVQEASSMLIGFIIENVIGPDSIKLAIDLCAAPGGKTTQLLSKLPATSFVIANEVTPSRLGALRHNLQKWGHTNVLVTNYTSSAFANAGIRADLVLIDAPCSGEGLFRKDPDSIGHWSEVNQQQCMRTQQNILDQAHLFVNEGGTLIYSTCTFHPGENIEQIATAVASGHFECLNVPLPASWGITEMNMQGATGYQCYPHKTRGEGFFFAVLKRTKKHTGTSVDGGSFHTSGYQKMPINGTALLPQQLQQRSEELWVDATGNIFLMPRGVVNYLEKMHFKPLFELGQLMGTSFQPSHGLAMIPEFWDIYPVLEVDYTQAIRYLKRIDFSFDRQENGIYFIAYKGLVLGLAKVMDHRTNNYLPMHRRILK